MLDICLRRISMQIIMKALDPTGRALSKLCRLDRQSGALFEQSGSYTVLGREFVDPIFVEGEDG